MVNAADVVWILAQQAVSYLLRMGVLGWPAGAFGVTEADAVVAGLGGDFREKKHDLGHGFLPAGEHFRVADWSLQGQGQRGEQHAADAVARGAAG